MDALIAHRSRSVRRALARVLQGQGVDLVEAADGPAAFGILMAAGAPRLALVDWDLGELDGPGLCRLLRYFNFGQPPYVILLKPAGSERDTAAGLQAGANDFVVLPASVADLRERVEYARSLVELPWGEAAFMC